MMASKVINQILEQRYALEIASTGAFDNYKISTLLETNHATYRMIESLEYTLQRQRELGTISDDQEHLSEKIQIIKDSFENIVLCFEHDQKNLWDLGQLNINEDSLFEQNCQKFQSIDAVKESIKLCTYFCGSFQDLVLFSDSGNPDPLSARTKIKSFLSNTTFGTIDQLRVELETTYRGVQVWLEADDGKKID